MPTHAKVYRFHAYGGPEALKLDTLPVPEPGHGEVRLKVEALSLNRADLLWLANTYIETPSLPSRIGYEVAGVVEAVGPDVTAWRVGDRVSSIPTFSIGRYANFGERALLPAAGLMRTPAGFSPREAVSFAFAYFTGYLALFELAKLRPYQTVLVTAATSTTGLAAIALIRKAGARVIATTRTHEKRQQLHDAGADHVIATREEDLVARVKELTGGEGVDIVYDCVAGELSEQLARSVKTGGRWIVYGLLDTPGAFPWWQGFLFKFDMFMVFHYTGNPTLKLPVNEPALRRALDFIASGLADKSLPHVPIDREFQGLEMLPEALRYMSSNQAAGKIVVTL